MIGHCPEIEMIKLGGMDQTGKHYKFNKTKGILRKTDIQVQLINNI